MIYPQSQLPDSHEMWIKASAFCNARLHAERELLRAQQATFDLTGEPEEYDVTDIEEFFQKFGKGTHFLEYDFTPDTPQPVKYMTKSGEESFYHCWTHKYTNESVKRFAQKGRNAPDSGRLSKYLLSIKPRLYPLASAHAKKILSLNESPTLYSPEECDVPVSVMSREDILKQQVRLNKTLRRYFETTGKIEQNIDDLSIALLTTFPLSFAFHSHTGESSPLHCRSWSGGNRCTRCLCKEVFLHARPSSCATTQPCVHEDCTLARAGNLPRVQTID
jgi:hypothetical protein